MREEDKAWPDWLKDYLPEVSMRLGLYTPVPSSIPVVMDCTVYDNGLPNDLAQFYLDKYRTPPWLRAGEPTVTDGIQMRGDSLADLATTMDSAPVRDKLWKIWQ